MDRPYRGWLQITSAADSPCASNQPENGQEPIAGNQEVGTLTQLSQNDKPVIPSRSAFHGRLILLVDGGCVSVCKDFSVLFSIPTAPTKAICFLLVASRYF